MRINLVYAQLLLVTVIISFSYATAKHNYPLSYADEVDETEKPYRYYDKSRSSPSNALELYDLGESRHQRSIQKHINSCVRLRLAIDRGAVLSVKTLTKRYAKLCSKFDDKVSENINHIRLRSKNDDGQFLSIPSHQAVYMNLNDGSLDTSYNGNTSEADSHNIDECRKSINKAFSFLPAESYVVKRMCQKLDRILVGTSEKLEQSKSELEKLRILCEVTIEFIADGLPRSVVKTIEKACKLFKNGVDIPRVEIEKVIEQPKEYTQIEEGGLQTCRERIHGVVRIFPTNGRIITGMCKRLESILPETAKRLRAPLSSTQRARILCGTTIEVVAGGLPVGLEKIIRKSCNLIDSTTTPYIDMLPPVDDYSVMPRQTEEVCDRLVPILQSVQIIPQIIIDALVTLCTYIVTRLWVVLDAIGAE